MYKSIWVPVTEILITKSAFYNNQYIAIYLRMLFNLWTQTCVRCHRLPTNKEEHVQQTQFIPEWSHFYESKG